MVSVILPIYKVEKYLRKCVDSILAQTYRDLEVILVDDGSPDSCPAICDEYAAADPRVIVVHKKNGGVSSARNAGLARAMGEYIGFVDPDDYIAPEMYERMVAGMEQKVDLVICGYDYISEDGNTTRPYPCAADERLSQEAFMAKLFDMPPTVRHGVVNKLFRKEIMQGIRFPENLHSSEDVWVLTEYAKGVGHALFIHQPLYMNLVRQGSATHGGLKVESLAASFSAHERMHKEAVGLYPRLKDHSLAFLLDVCLLKYNEAKRQYHEAEPEARKDLKRCLAGMKKFIKRYAWSGLFCREIYWKTRVMYILF